MFDLKTILGFAGIKDLHIETDSPDTVFTLEFKSGGSDQKIILTAGDIVNDVNNIPGASENKPSIMERLALGIKHPPKK